MQTHTLHTQYTIKLTKNSRLSIKTLLFHYV